MNPVNINIDRPNFDKTNSSRNMEVMNRWISDTSDKLNYLISLINAGKIGGENISDDASVFDSSDTEDGNASEWTAVKTLESGENKRSILQKISQMFRNTRFLFKVLGDTDISTVGNGTITGAINSLNADLAKQWEKIYPVGSIYISANSSSPANLFGGTWEQIKDRFLLAAGDAYAAGSTGGEATHTLTVDEMPAHYHDELYFEEPGKDKFGINNYNQYHPGAPKGTWKIEYSKADSEAWFVTGYAGGSKPHNNLPPYLTVYMWKRVS